MKYGWIGIGITWQHTVVYMMVKRLQKVNHKKTLNNGLPNINVLREKILKR